MINVINGLYESGVSIAERQAAEAVKNGNFRPDTLLALPPTFESFFYPSVWLLLYATLSSPVQLAVTGH